MGIYSEVGDIVMRIKNRKGTLKSLLYKDGGDAKKKSVMALVCETLKYDRVLSNLVDVVLEDDMRERQKCVVQAMVYDLLFGKKKILGGGYLKKKILKKRSRLVSQLARMKITQGAIENEDLLPPHLRAAAKLKIPRYARVNTLKTTKVEVLRRLEQDKYKLMPCVRNGTPQELDLFWLDDTVPDLLVFHPKGILPGHKLVKDSHLIFQDKASCLPATVMDVQPVWTVLEACAAPGNKAIHLAALLSSDGKKRKQVIALERDPKRFKTLCSRVKAMGGGEVVDCRNEDFLSLKLSEYKNVDAILLDPSCSGSGLRYQGSGGRLEHLLAKISKIEGEENEDEQKQEEEEKERARKLALFQRKALRQATKFPNVNRIVYSTCSVHRVENEDVVEAVLETENGWQLVPVLPDWQPRGLSGIESIRADPEANKCNGFFVAVIERKKKKKRKLDSKESGGTAPDAKKMKTI